MYRIGTVARLAQVSVRTLHHYEEMGLLVPARVDPHSGYRWYEPHQLARLHRILALRDLGVPLREIGELLDADVTVEQLRGILLLRHAEARDRITTESERLQRVEVRLDLLEGTPMDHHDVIVKPIEPVLVVATSGQVDEPEEIGDLLGRLYPKLYAVLGRYGVTPREPSYALYEHVNAGEGALLVTAALPVPDDAAIDDDGVNTIELPAAARAATTVVRGSPEQCFHEAFRVLHDWAQRTGEHPTGLDREVYLDCNGPRDAWVTELQLLLEPRR